MGVPGLPSTEGNSGKIIGHKSSKTTAAYNQSIYGFRNSRYLFWTNEVLFSLVFPSSHPPNSAP
jgi:hypothetical protein